MKAFQRPSPLQLALIGCVVLAVACATWAAFDPADARGLHKLAAISAVLALAVAVLDRTGG